MKQNLTPKTRILNALQGLEIDHVPWSPFLAYYWDFLPKSIQSKGQFSYLKDMGADPILRGSHELFKVNYKNCTISTSVQGNTKTITYDTPVGSLQEIYTFTPHSNSWFLTGHPVSEEEDFKILQFIYENMELTENFTAFHNDFHTIKDEGLLLPLLGVRSKTSFQALVEHWCGTVNLTYALFDFEETVAECLAVMNEKDMETAEISVKSDAEAFLFYEDSSTTNISPAFFEAYTLPAINHWGEILHKNDKLLIHHACGHLKDLLPLMNQSAADVIESVSPPPTGNIDIPEAFLLLNQNKGIIGGLEPTFLLNCSLQDLEKRVHDLLSSTQGRRYILANSDSCPPNVTYEKFLLINRIIQESSKSKKPL
ncbi:MAG: hypothetical protein KH828_12260 [Clostridiales bacterium]|nr:hypothetical protein [Clostridiales bacterium]